VVDGAVYLDGGSCGGLYGFDAQIGAQMFFYGQLELSALALNVTPPSGAVP
jgi:hypothetical protein